MTYTHIYIHSHGHELRGRIARGIGGYWEEGSKGEKLGTIVIAKSIKYI